MKNFKTIRIFCISFLTLVCIMNIIQLHAQSRRNYRLPDIPGFVTLKGDFHMHTLFSDGSVWPSDRVKEAWRDGIDIIALTDHIEYPSHSTDIINNLNRPYEIASATANELGIILIKGAEITRSMPPGHFNAYFLKDINTLKDKNLEDVFRLAAEQGAYFEWNHPGWKAQQPDTTIWFPMHTELYNKGYLNGIEVFNEKEYYPIVFQWAIDKNLSIFANSDSHEPMDIQYDARKNEFRPMTLVFARERSEEAVKEAMIQHRTAVLFRDTMLGSEEFLSPLIEECLKIEKTNSASNDRMNFMLTNVSDFPLTLKNIASTEFSIPSTINIPANSSVVFAVKNFQHLQSAYNTLIFRFNVMNALKAPSIPIEIKLSAQVFYWNTCQFEISSDSKVKIKNLSNSDSIQYFYTIDGSIPNRNSKNINESFDFRNTLMLKIAALTKNNTVVSTYSEEVFLHSAVSQKVTLKKEPNPKYNGGGAQGLTNGILGSSDYSDGKWLGFETDDLECVIELNHSMDIHSVNMGFLEATKSWIFLPTYVQIMVSTDGITFTDFGKTIIKDGKKESNKGRTSIVVNGKAKNIRYIKVIAKNQGVCPIWHSGAGKPCWLFADEIEVQ